MSDDPMQAQGAMLKAHAAVAKAVTDEAQLVSRAGREAHAPPAESVPAEAEGGPAAEAGPARAAPKPKPRPSSRN